MVFNFSYRNPSVPSITKRTAQVMPRTLHKVPTDTAAHELETAENPRLSSSCSPALPPSLSPICRLQALLLSSSASERIAGSTPRREVSRLRLRSGARPPRTPPRLPHLASDSVRSALSTRALGEASGSFRVYPGISLPRDGGTGSLGLAKFLSRISVGASLSGAYFICIYRCLRFTAKFVAAWGFGVWSQSCALHWWQQRLVGCGHHEFRVPRKQGRH